MPSAEVARRARDVEVRLINTLAESSTPPPPGTIGIQAVNLLLFLVLLFVFARRPILDALGNRANQVRRDLDESARLKDEAEARYRDIEQKLAGLDHRIEEMKAQAASEAKSEAARIAERAEADAIRIRDTAERTIREESQRARSEIRREVVVQATAAAREIVRQNVGSADQAKLEAEFMASVSTKANGTGSGA